MRADINQPTTGDCECCDRINVVVTRRHNDLMCSACIELEDNAINRQRAVETIEKSVQIDATIELKTDIFNAATVPFTELRVAIQHNDAIPADQKEYELVKMAAERIKLMNAAIIADEQALMLKKNERHAWLTNVQEVASRLRTDYREKFRQFDLSYEPKPVKSTKPKAVKAPGTDTTKTEVRKAVNEAAKKYSVDASVIRMMMLSRAGLSPDDAAKELAKLMGK